MRIVLVGAAAIGVAGCEHAAGDLGRCYDGMFNSFCVVNTPPGTTLSTGVGIVPSIGTLMGGAGGVLVGEGSIVSGVATIVHVP